MQYLQVEFLHWETLLALLCHIKREYPGASCSVLCDAICQAWPKTSSALSRIAHRLRTEHWIVEKESLCRRFRPEWKYPLPRGSTALLWRPQRSKSFVWGQPTVWFDQTQRVAWLMPRGLAAWPTFSIDHTGYTLKIYRAESAFLASPTTVDEAFSTLLSDCCHNE